MEKNCLRKLEALVNSFTFYPKRFLKKPLYQALWPKIRIFEWNCIPPVGQKSEIAPKFFPRLFILGLALSIAKVSTRSGCYTWKTSLVSTFESLKTLYYNYCSQNSSKPDAYWRLCHLFLTKFSTFNFNETYFELKRDI